MGATDAVPTKRVPVVPFRKATVRKRGLLSSVALNAALGDSVSWELDSKGYIGGLRLLFSGSETTSTADPGASADFPFNLAQRIELRDSSGGMVVSMKGYSAYLAKRFFSPMSGSARDLTQSGESRIYSVSISAVQANTLAWSQGIDVEAGTKDNLGVLPNQNAAFKYVLSLQVDTEANIITTPANATWALNVQPSYRYYTVPSPTRADGAKQEVAPPFAGIVRQQWDEARAIPATGVSTRYNLTVGKVIRNLILVSRNASNVRAGSLARITMKYGDDVLLFDATEQDIVEEMFRQYGKTASSTFPTGVYVIPFTADNDGFVGADFRRDLLDTRKLSQIWMDITWNASGSPTQFDIIHDELIVPANMSI